MRSDTPLPAARLAEIRARHWGDGEAAKTIAALLAEVERLQEALREWLALECRRPKAASNTVFVDTRGWEFLKSETRAVLGEDHT